MLNIYLDLDGVIHRTLPLEKYEDERCFSRVATYEYATHFIKKLNKLGKVKVLSKAFFPTNHAKFANQKQDKINKCLELGFNLEDIIILGSEVDKNIYSKDSILIDDYGHNCKLWSTEGTAIQFREHKQKDWATATDWKLAIKKIRQLLKGGENV